MAKFFDVYALTDDDTHIVEVYQANDEDHACDLFKRDHPDIQHYQRIHATQSFNHAAIEQKYGRSSANK